MYVRGMAQDSRLGKKSGPFAKRAPSRGDDYSRTRHQEQIDDVRSGWRPRNGWHPHQQRDFIIGSVRKYCDGQNPSSNIPNLLDQIGEILLGSANSADMREILTHSQAPEVAATDVDRHHWRPQGSRFFFVLITYYR
jgi:hypothetical protein